MAGIFQKVINRAVQSAFKTHTVTFQPTDHNTFRLLGDFFGGATVYDLHKFLKAYETNPLVFEVIDKIKDHVSVLPVKVEDQKGKELKQSRILDLIDKDLIELITISLASSGNAFVYLVQGVGIGEELEFWYADNVEAIINSKTGIVTEYRYTNSQGVIITVRDIENVIHIKYNGSLQVEGTQLKLGLSPLQPMWDVVEGSKERFIAMKSTTKNRGVAGALSNDSEIPMLPEQRQKQQDLFDKNTQGSEKMGSIYVSANRLKYLQFGMSPSDLKLLEGTTEDLRRLASAYKLSSVLFNDVANSKFDNMNEANSQAYLNCYIPIGTKIYDSLFLWLNGIFETEEVPKIDKTQIESIKAMTNFVAQSLNQLPTIAQEYVLAQMNAEQLLNLVGAEVEGGAVGFKNQSNQTNDEGQES